MEEVCGPLLARYGGDDYFGAKTLETLDKALRESASLTLALRQMALSPATNLLNLKVRVSLPTCCAALARRCVLLCQETPPDPMPPAPHGRFCPQMIGPLPPGGPPHRVALAPPHAEGRQGAADDDGTSVVLSEEDTAVEACGRDLLAVFSALRARMIQQQAVRASATTALPPLLFDGGGGPSQVAASAASAARRQQRLLRLANPARVAWEDNYFALWTLWTQFVGLLQQAHSLARGGFVGGGPEARQRVYLEVRRPTGTGRK